MQPGLMYPRRNRFAPLVVKVIVWQRRDRAAGLRVESVAFVEPV